MAAASVAEAANLANAALPGGGGLKSGASSPTQALLPHVDTSTSALSTVLSEKVQGEAAATTAGSTNNKTSRSASLFANLKKPHFMQNFAKSISLPSPKLRAAVKNMATYEIKVEHQVPKEDISSPSEEMVTESVLAEVKTTRSSKDSVLFIKEEKVNVVATTTTTIVQEQPPLTASMSLTTFGSRPVRSTLPMSSSFRTTASSGKPFVDQPLASDSVTSTTTSGIKRPQLLPSSIAQSKVLEKVKALEATDQNKRPQKEDSDHVIETSASNPAVAVLQPLPPTTEYVVASIVSSTSTTVASVVNTQQTSKTQLTTQSSSSSYSQDPKLAFPHSSSFAGRASSAFTTSSAASTATVASVSNRVGSSHSANSLRLATSSAAASKVSSTSASATTNTSSADVVVKQQKIGSNKTDYYSEALKQISAVSSLSSKSSSSKAAPPPPPPKPTSISTKSFVDRSSSIKSSHYKDDVKSQQHQKASKTTEEATDAPDGGRNSNKVKTPSPTKSSTATTTKALSPVTTTAYSITSSSTSATMPLLSKTSTLPSPTSSSSASTRKGFGMSKSSTLPIVPSRPVISKPVLQMATPDAASLISKSHSTGVSQSSIIKGDHKISIGGSGTDGVSEASAKETKEAKRTSRGVVFCDPLTLPSPTNPNNPPIIHIQPKPTAPTVTTPPKPTPPPTTTTSVTSAPATTSAAMPSSKPIEAKAVIVSSVITPTWSTEAVTSTAVLCHIDDTDSGSEGARSPCKKDSNGAPMASPDESEDVVGGDGHHHQSQPAPPPPSQPQLVKKSKSLSKSLKSKLVKRSQSEKKDRNNSSSSSSKTQDEMTIITSSGLSSPTSSVRSSSNDHHPPTTLPLQAQPVKPPQPPRPERGPIRKLDISGPILLHQTNMSTEIKGNFLPVCRAADATPTESTPQISFAQATTASSSTSSTAAKVDLILKENKDVMVDILLKDNSKVINKVKGNGASPSNTTTARVFEYPAIAATTTTSSSTTSKVISPTGSKDSSPSHKKNKAPQPPPIIPRRQSPSKSAGSGGGLASSVKPSDLPVGATAAPGAISSAKKISMKRPASIATTRPSRPSAPPPRPPQQKPNVGGSPTRSDTSSLASVDSSSSTATSKGPSAATSSDESTNNSSQKTSTSNNKKIIPSPLTSPLSLDDFDTPLSSPIIARRSPDALSTASSSDGDLMREILKDLDTEVKDEVSTLMRKKNKNKKKIVD